MRKWVLVAVVLATASCAANENQGWVEPAPVPEQVAESFRIVGTVQFVDVEGGVFIIRDAEGRNFNPINLPEAFKRDGLAVEADARQREDLTSTAMVAQMVEILRIRMTGRSN